MPQRFFDGLTLFRRTRLHTTTATSSVRRTAYRQTSKSLDMSDPAIFRHEAVVPLNELLYLNIGRHPLPPHAHARARTMPHGATAATLLRGESGSAGFT